MSWKSFVTAGLMCVLASPAFAAPTITAVGGGTQPNTSGRLDANGNWVWQVQIATSNPVPTGSTPLAAELGLRETSSRNIVGDATISNPAVWDTPNPGNTIFGWETPGPDGDPVGVDTNNATDEVFAAVGSALISTTAPQNFLRIEVQRPVTATAGTLSTTTLTLDGAYDAAGNAVAAPGGDRARVAELTTSSDDSANYHYQGSVTMSAKGGDANLDGTISAADYSVLLANFNTNDGQRQWYHADFNGDNDVSAADYSQLLANFGAANNYTVLSGSFNAVPPPGAGSGAVAAPEPASVVLLALASLGVAGLRFRRR